MSLSAATLEADGFVRDARDGLFYELGADGVPRRFGLLRPGPEPGEDAGWTVEIAADGASALSRSWSQGIHPHPDGDPAFSVAMWTDLQRQLLKDRAAGVLRCGFCEKTQAEVRKLIAGPSLYICDECAALCAEIAVS